ncbi:MAG: hypothetical protein HKN47_07270 [Pirellulaceae bacterium]|nr:hypothetical protein [Pirellulaceae bacterium]
MNSPHPSKEKPIVHQDRCPLCEAEVHVEPTALFGDMNCPSCDQKLWYLNAADSARFFEHQTSGELQDRAISFIAERLEVDKTQLAANPKMINELETDSLEALEMIMDLEEELGFV